jgi:hypothetical protein
MERENAVRGPLAPPPPKDDPLVGGDPTVEKLFAQVRKGKRTEAKAWLKLAQYLATHPLDDE